MRQLRVLIIVQNLSVPFYGRVWLECLSLTDAGFTVAVCLAQRLRATCPM